LRDVVDRVDLRTLKRRGSSRVTPIGMREAQEILRLFLLRPFI